MKHTKPIPTEVEMRAAIAARDIDYDDRFVFGVVTTSVFCRPSCAARPARPENLRFFSDAEAAAEAGFRACKRCRPTEAASGMGNLVVMARYIEEHASERLTLAQLARHAGLSASRFQRAFKNAFGVSPKVYQDQFRLRRFKEALKHGGGVTDAIFDAGFGSTSRVYGAAARNIGMTPSSYRAGGEGETIAYAHRQTSLGGLLMAATDRGVCFAQFGDNAATLLDQVRSEFPNANLVASGAEDSPELDEWVAALDAHITSGSPVPDLPLDLRGTAFQIKVWKFLTTLDAGVVISYGELAKGIDQAKAVRAAATACGANRIAVLIPCHRVLRSDGGIGGYRWGLVRKRALLDMERARRAATTA